MTTTRGWCYGDAKGFATWSVRPPEGRQRAATGSLPGVAILTERIFEWAGFEFAEHATDFELHVMSGGGVQHSKQRVQR